MNWIVQNLWLIPVLPLLAAGLSSVARQRNRVFAASLAIGSMVLSFLLSLAAIVHVYGLTGSGTPAREVFNFRWFQFGSEWLSLGWVLDPLTAIMLVMVTFVGTLIFIYSVGYMAHDENFTRFFCFLSLFAAAMLGVVIANSLLLLFMCWELVGLTSYLLIGFWYHRPSAAAAAKKAFITTRIGDLPFLLGIVWLYAQTGTLLFYNGGAGAIEHSALTAMVAQITSSGMAVSTAIALLIFCGAVGKSGQVPLHVWLPDAMEGPTPVSALIHAATMVAAGVFLVARVYPLMSASPALLAPGAIETAITATTALKVVTWIGAITAVFAASIAVAQNDIKRILAYSTVSQLGYMMLGLGVGGVAVGFFHLITHAFFKSLLFMGAGSVIHGCHEEQDIRRMGGLRKWMPVTFAAYSVGMLALCGFPLFFSGFWSKDEILHSAHLWTVSRMPFYLGVIGAFLTAFYMTRQMFYVFFGKSRLASADQHETPHESPSVMTTPLVILATCSVLLGFVGTPAWNAFHAFLQGERIGVDFSRFGENGILPVMLSSSLVVFLGLTLGWWFYGRKPVPAADQPDALDAIQPQLFRVLANKFYVDELYEATFIRFNAWAARASDWLDRWVWGGGVQLVSRSVLALSWFNRLLDTNVVNSGFDAGCQGAARGARILSHLQNGRVQNYLRMIGVALVFFVLFLIWGSKG
ncbi:MAG TPA: NADH-quinone oxidoreductase subunit L [Acidisarcina sp.]|nr:NADH-quinone oxidoreductase subunit L [Acidisarcina sp.]